MNVKKKRLSRGFTLVELIVVITIIGILASYVVVNYPRFIKKAQYTRAKADINSITKAANSFKMEFFRYPESTDEMVHPPESNDGMTTDPFIDEIPMDPWNHPYNYSIEDGKPLVTSYGEDGQEGTQDDISNAKKSDNL